MTCQCHNLLNDDVTTTQTRAEFRCPTVFTTSLKRFKFSIIFTASLASTAEPFSTLEQGSCTQVTPITVRDQFFKTNPSFSELPHKQNDRNCALIQHKHGPPFLNHAFGHTYLNEECANNQYRHQRRIQETEQSIMSRLPLAKYQFYNMEFRYDIIQVLIAEPSKRCFRRCRGPVQHLGSI